MSKGASPSEELQESLRVECSPESYRLLLRRATERGYAFIGFLDEVDAADGRICLRHDVDYSLQLAVHLARINAALGIRATFFILVCSQVYNALGPRSLACAREIQQLGQRLGLHCAVPDPLPVEDADLRAEVERQMEVLRAYLTGVEPVFSWHNPTPELLARTRDLAWQELVCTYGEAHIGRMQYFSDSNMRMTFHDLDSALGGPLGKGVQLLLHPEIWMMGGQDIVEVLCKTWDWMIREHEFGVNENSEWVRRLPGRIPQEVVDAFVGQVRTAAGR